MRKALDQFNDNLIATLDRGKDLDEGIEQSNVLANSAKDYHDVSKKVNRTMCCRKYMVYIIGTLIVLGIIGVIIIIT
jgi:hypothetical protein